MDGARSFADRALDGAAKVLVHPVEGASCRSGSARATASGRSKDWLKFKNPEAPAVKWEAEEDWGIGKLLEKPRMDRIDTYSEFKRSVVEPDFREFMENKADLRKAWHCAGSLFHLHEWVYAAHKASIDRKYMFVDDYRKTKPVSCPADFATSLGQKYSDFQLVRGIANASKHFVLHPVPPSRVNPPGMPSHAANTYVSAAKWDSAIWDQDVFDDVGEVKLQRSTGDIEFATLAQSVWDMWNQLFANESW